MTRNRAPVAEYISAPIPGFGSDIIPSLQESTLTAMWYNYKDAESVAFEANNKIRSIGNYWYYDQRLLKQSLRSIERSAGNKMRQLQTISLLCKNDESRCDFSPDTAIKDVDWPSLDVSMLSSDSQCNGTLCTATINLVVRPTGPSSAGNPIPSQMSIKTSQPINSDCLPSLSNASSVTVRCILNYARNADSVEKSQITISSSSTGNIAFNMLLSEFYPNISR